MPPTTPPSPTPAPKPIGRPRDPAKVDAIVDAGWHLFLARGVAAVTTDQIAADAHVAKATVYAYFPDKRALFQEGVKREMAKIESAQALAAAGAPGADLREVLLAFGRGIMAFLTSPTAVDFYASLAGELRRDPELARMFHDAGPGRTQANLAGILTSPLAADLDIADPATAADMLLGMWQGMTNYRTMLGVEHDAVVADIPRRVEEGVDRFMRAFARQS